MCGIVGWLSTSGSSPVALEVLSRMRDTMAHRGPDGVGLWIAGDCVVGLGFRRLAIVDLSPAASQPMPNEDGTVYVVFNGEIYNHAKLRRELLDAGHKFRTDHSDTEAIVHGYEEWGASVVDRLEGMFAIGIWDARRRSLLLVRDRIGIKPLYFSFLPGGFVFASEIKALLAHPALSPDLEPVAAYHYLSFLATPAPLTMFRGIYKLPAGHSAVVRPDGSFRVQRWWDALPGRSERAREILVARPAVRRSLAVAAVRELLDQAVEKRMMSDVPFGVFLSGGIDSTTNVALMRRHMNRPVRTFTVGFADGDEYNEMEWANRVSKHFGTDHHEVIVDEAAMRNYLPALIVSQDEPIADWTCIPLFFVSELARRSGTIVVQVGEGSDEQFCGYRNYMAQLLMHKFYWRTMGHVPEGARRIASRLGKRVADRTDRFDRYLDYFLRSFAQEEPFWSGAHVFSEFRKERMIDRLRIERLSLPDSLRSSGIVPESFLGPDSAGVVDAFFERLDSNAPGSDQLTRMAYAEFKLRLPELLLMKVDKIGMSASIEPRVPFLDHALVELTMSLPAELKIGWGRPKDLLKRAVRGLIPNDVIDRPKQGFDAPMARWLRSDFGSSVEAEFHVSRFFDRFPLRRETALDMLERHRGGRVDLSRYLWAIYNAVAWFDEWVDGLRGGRAV
jgi:asparagine synthase (glutamine-hydrolysing)